MKVLKFKNSEKIASFVPIDDEAIGRHGWYVAGAVCWNPDLICHLGEEEANGYEVVEMTEEELEAALKKMGVDFL